MTSRPPRVLVLTMSFGSGHARAASAVAAELRRQAPDADVRVRDALAGAGRLFLAGYVWPYWAMLRYAPYLWDRLFSARLRQASRQTAPAWAFRAGCPLVFDAISQFQPDVIVAAEVGACEIAVLARRRGLTASPIVAVITDHHAEPAWVHPEVSLHAVADDAVREQLCQWGAPRDRVRVCGIPTDDSFQQPADPAATRARYGAADGRPLVLVMGGGMGPSRMDRIAARMCASGQPMHVVAVAGFDRRAKRRLTRVRSSGMSSLTVCGWTDEVPALMKSASVLVTKPGGLTTAEAAMCGVPSILFDPIPGPEEHNAACAVRAGAALLARGADEAVAAVLSVLADGPRRARMAERARSVATPSAAREIAALVLRAHDAAALDGDRSVLILTIRNGAGHTRVAQAIGEALEDATTATAVSILDVSDYMSFAARLTHLTIYLWLVKHAPRVWDRIDSIQKRRSHTSPEWYYRRGCRRLFDLVRRRPPRAIVATEVGCCECAALIKRDLGLRCPLVAVNGEYDADRAWVQPEVTVYSVPNVAVRDQLCALGAQPHRVHAWGVPVSRPFSTSPRRREARAAICGRLGLSTALPLVLVAGGSEGLGRPDAVARRLLDLSRVNAQIIVLAGRNESLRRRCEALGRNGQERRLRVLGWTEHVRELMEASDLLVSKLGHTFDEAMATALPIVALEPPPGSERVQYRLLEPWGVGRAVRTLDEMQAVVERLLLDPSELEAMRHAAMRRHDGNAARAIARWMGDATAARGPASVPVHAEGPA